MSRIPFVAAVVGALLIGGATTGGTHANWVQSQQLSSSSVRSGSMNFTLGSPSTLANLNSTAGSEGSATFVATDTGVGKNLVQRITATVTGAPSGVTAYVAAGSTCSSITSSSDFADKRPSDSSRTQTFCVRVISSSTAVSGNVTVNVASAQRPSGWSVAATTVTIPVTIVQPAPSAPTLSCAATYADPNARTFNWANLGAGITYQVYRQAPGASAFAPIGSTQTTTSYTETQLAKDETSYFKVKAIKNGVESAFSGSVMITRNGASSNYNCAVQ